MHFWINKPAGRYYGFPGRRYPVTSMPKIRFNQCRCGREHGQTVTSVPHCQGLGIAANTAGSFNSSRTLRSALCSSNENRHDSSVNAAQFTQLNNDPNNVADAGNNQLILSNATDGGTNRNHLEDAEYAGYRLRCGIWTTFVFATGFVAAAKFYFSYRGPGLEIFVFCGLLLLLLSACLYSIFCRRNQNYSRQEHGIQEEHINRISENTVSENTRAVSLPVRQNPPPPYHIAILIPPPDPSEEAPPPSYDKVMR